MTLLIHPPHLSISNKKAYISLSVIILLVLAIEIDELWQPEAIYGTSFDIVNDGIILDCNNILNTMNRSVPAWYMVCWSDAYLGNARILPFVFSMALLPLTFLVARQITKNNIVSLVATTGLAVNPLFWLFNDTSTFHQFWVVWLLLSIYFIEKKPILAGPFYVLAIFSKAMPLLFLPIIIYYTIKSNCKNKKLVVASYSMICLAIGVYVIADGNIVIQGNMEKPLIFEFLLDEPQYVKGLENTWWNITKHTAGLGAVLFFVSAVSSWFYNKKIFWFIVGIFCTIPLLEIFTPYSSWPYRLLPLVVFMSIGASIFFIKLLSYILKIPYDKNQDDSLICSRF